MRKSIKKAVTFILVVSVCFGSAGMTALGHEEAVLSLEEQTVTDSKNIESGGMLQDDDEDYFDIELTKYEGEKFQVINCLTDRWDGGFNASFVVNNTSNMDIRNWYIKFPAQFDIANIWNAEIESEEDGVYLVKNVGWNSIIEAGGSVQFYVTVYENFTEFPSHYDLLGTSAKISEDIYKITYEVYDTWNEGFTGAIKINNMSDEVIEDWKLEFDSKNEFTDIWNAEIILNEGVHYELQNAGYNRDIGVGESVSIGFVVDSGDANVMLTNIALSAFSLEASLEDERNEKQEEQEKSYVKDAAEEDIIFDKEACIHYVKNQIIVSTHLGASKELMKNLANEIGADIVGYIDLIADYQLEFREDIPYTKLMEKIAYVKSFPFVRYAEVNLVSQCEEQAFSNDALYDSERTPHLIATEWYDENGKILMDTEAWNSEVAYANDGWGKWTVGGNNWGLEAINVHNAWEYKDRFQGTVKVGVLDNMFGENEDIEFEQIIGNKTVIDDKHGTHVAGIIGAKHNNGIGISGVATDVQLYGYTTYGSSNTIYYQLERLVKCKVRVINISMGYSGARDYAATVDENAANAIKREAEALSGKLLKLIERGYDFLIVATAGNGNGAIYVENPEDEYGFGYSAYDPEKEEYDNLVKVVGYPDAKYNHYVTAIEDKVVKGRIIVVGAVNNLGGNKFEVASFSQEGSRVDIYAPGVHILSTVPKKGFKVQYMTASGTSQAAPHISGLAALMLQANPNITAAQIKRIITNDANAGYEVGKSKYMPDAAKCVLEALNTSN